MKGGERRGMGKMGGGMGVTKGGERWMVVEGESRKAVSSVGRDG